MMNVAWLMTPNIFVLRLLGLAPFSIQNTSPGKIQFRISYIWYGIAILSQLLMVYLYFVHFASSYRENNLFYVMVRTLSYLTLTFNLITALTLLCFAPSLLKLINELAEYNYQWNKKLFYKELFIQVIFIIIVSLYLVTGIISQKKYFNILVQYIRIYSTFSAIEGVMLFCSLLEKINLHFKILNQRLDETLGKYDRNKLINPNDYQLEISRICHQHAHFIQIANRINSIFWFQLLLFNLMTFVIVTSISFYFTCILIGLDMSFLGYGKRNFTIFLFMILLLYGGQMFFLTYKCTQITKESQKTSFILNKYKTQEFTTDINNQLEDFGLQLLHNKNFSITIGGLFSLDMIHILNMIWSIFMYIMIIVQNMRVILALSRKN